MKKIIGLPEQIESCDRLWTNSCCKVHARMIKFCFGCMLMITFLGYSTISITAMDYGNESRVMEAYGLRINGKADKAKELLQELLLTDSTNALANFEMARTKHHLFLGTTQFSSEEWTEVMHSLQQAVKYAPENELYAFYYAYSCFFNAFISMMRQNPDVAENVARACDAFKAVLKLNPDCHAAQLYMVDIYGMLPEEMGGDKEKARIIASDLNKKDVLFGAMASARLLPDTTDFVEYWQQVGEKEGLNALVMEELGRAYLLKGDTENGTKYFEEAMQADITRKHLMMQLARYHLLSTQQNPDAKAVHVERAIKHIESYMQSTPDLVPSLKAYAYGVMSIIRMVGGDNNAGDEYQGMAKSIDPYYSKAMGMAPAMLYCRPNEVIIQYSSFFMPF